MATYPLSEAFTDGQVLTAANVNATNEGVNDIAFAVLKTIAFVSGNYTLVLSDVAKWLYVTDGAATTITIPTNASVAFPTGTIIMVVQYGTGQLTATPSGGVTLRAQGNKTKTAGQYAVASLLKVDTNEWFFFGNTVI